VADGGAPISARYEAGYPSDFNPSPPAARSADAEIYSAGVKLRDWARFLAKNSSIVKAVLDSRVAKGVGCGLTYKPMVRDRKGNLLPELNAAIKRWHDKWSERADVTGELSRQEIERLVWRDTDVAGEVFARKVYRGRTRDKIGYQVQLIPAELVPYGFITQSRAVMGVDRDEWGAPSRYWVYPYHPDAYAWQYRVPSLEPKPVQASDMLHLRRQEELQATRGVTLFHAVIFRASDIAEFQQSHRRAARASANLFASINRDISYDGAESTPEGANATTGQNELNLLDLQILDFLKAGESVNFHTPSHPNQNAVEFVNQELRQFASACRVAFSWIAYVFDRAYAAQRTELIHAWEMIQEDRAHFIRDFARPALYAEPLRMALLECRLPARELRKANPDTLYDVRIEGPVMPSIDPVKDRQSAALDQDNGWESRHGNIRRFGRDPDQVDAERESDSFVKAADMPAIAESEQDEQDEDGGAQTNEDAE
jgi:lambda family phage portal protein